ncbi:deoxyribose-phosphate aldolase [Puteibacter caeruleilacunae]|nr:deoxyribose-phosphate aldolase [Puteibacter caeruleilacunae]
MSENNQSFPLTREQISEEVSNIKLLARELFNKDYLKLALNCIDLTTLNATDHVERVKEFTENVNKFAAEYPQWGNVAAICVFPNMVASVEETLELPEVNIASVSAGFPSAMTFPEVKVLETELAIKARADEVDVVISQGAFLAGDYQLVHEEISQIRAATGEAHLKVIIESGVLDTPENIWRASLIAMNAGADFIKTSTGKVAPAATLEAAIVMCLAIRYHFEETGERIGFKAAGGITTPQEALEYMAVVNEILGEEWLNPLFFRIGASRLANNILSELEQKEIQFF